MITVTHLTFVLAAISRRRITLITKRRLRHPWLRRFIRARSTQ